MSKFKIDVNKDYIFRNIRFPRELFERINSVKGLATDSFDLD